MIPSIRTFSIDSKPLLVTGSLGVRCAFHPRVPLERLAYITPEQEDEHMDRELEYTPAKLILNIYEAANLANADLFGRSDPFVIIIWNGEEYGRTYVIQDTLNPVWKDQIFSLPVPRYKDVLDCQLELHVYDDQTIGQNQFLGCVTLTGTRLRNFLSLDQGGGEAGGGGWLDLKPSKYLSKKQNSLVQGSVFIHCSYSQSHRLLRRWSVDHLKINLYLFSAENLAQIEMRRKPNVFCVVRWKGNEVGRSSVIRKALNPKWNVAEDASCQFSLYFPDHLLEELGSSSSSCRLEVLLYHSDLCKETELLKNCLCLGRGIISGQHLLTILYESTTATAAGRPLEITPMTLTLEKSLTREDEDIECRPDTFHKITPQGLVEVGVTVTNSENSNETQLEQLMSQTAATATAASATALVCGGNAFDSSGVSSYNSTVELGNTFATPLWDDSQGLQYDATATTMPLIPFSSPSSSSAYKKYFDHQSGSFYYLNEMTGESSWDKPLDSEIIPLHHTSEELQQRFEKQFSLQQMKQKKLNEIQEVVKLIRYEHQENKQKLENEKKQKEDSRIHLIWQKALTIASQENNECNISWQPCHGIDKLLYRYESLFGQGKYLIKLRLVGIELKEIHEEFCENLQFLELLSLANNQLVTLPESLYLLNNLQILDLRNNLIQYLPKKIGLMSMHLTRLELCNNRLVELPNSFSSLYKLKKIDLENNLLQRLPENLQYLTSCEWININSNQLQRLPRSLGSMKKIKIFSCNKNKISYIPNEICRNTSLESLRLCSNCLINLPENLGQMKQLRELWLDHNYLSSLPGSMCWLSSLEILKLENNQTLQSPGYEIIQQGAQVVVNWCKKRYVEEGYWRRKQIILIIQNCLEQFTETTSMAHLIDTSRFESSYQWKNNLWYAFDLEYFWEFILPELNKRWRKIIDTYDHLPPPHAMTLSFPYNKKDVMWALTTFQDAYGPIFYQDVFANFKRCSCRDVFTKKRKVCIPPCKGYMCRKRCVLVKHEIVLQHEKEMRLWKEHKRISIEESVKRAENEALKFLKSDEGKLWIATMAYERAEEMMNLQGISFTYEWRDQLAEKRKQKIIQKYNSKKLKIEKIRDHKATKLLLKIDELKSKNKVTMEGGYAKESIQSSLQALYDELAALPENEMLKELHEKCEADCNEVEDDLLFTDTSDEDEEGKKRESYMERKLRLHQEAQQAIFDEVQGATVPDLPELEETPIKDLIFSALDVIPPKNRREVLLRRNKRRLKRSLRHAFDMVTTRLRKFQFILNGDFREIEQELEHETYVQYVTNAGAVAKRKAEREFYVLGRIRSQWKGLGLEAAFRGWKKYVKQRVHRQHADLRQQWRQETKQYESDLIAIHLAQAQLSLWEKFTDVYSDQPFWKNWQSQDVTWDEPKLEDYLPTGCNIPKIPIELPSNISEETSESEPDEDYRPRVRTGLMIGGEDEEEGEGSPGERKQSSNQVNVLRIENGQEGGGGGHENEEEEDDDEESESQVSHTENHDTRSEFLLKNGEENSWTSLPLVASVASSGAGTGSAGARGRGGRRESAQALIVREDSKADALDASASFSTQLTLPRSPKNTNDFTKQKWLPLISSQSSSTLQPHSAPPTNQLAVSLPNIHSRALTTYTPSTTSQQPQHRVVVYPSYSYGPDSLRAGKLPGRVGRPLFYDDESVASDEELLEESKWTIMTSDAERLLGQYDADPSSASSALILAQSHDPSQKRKQMNLTENAKLEKERALEAVRLRREQGKAQRHHTYMKQRNRRPRVHEELVEERRRREAVAKSFQEPTPEELLAMLNSNPDEVWRSDHMKIRTDLATKAVKLQKHIKSRAVKEGLIEEKKQGFLKTALMPLLNENYNPEEEEDGQDWTVKEKK